MLPVPGKSSGKWRDNDFLLPGKLLKMSPPIFMARTAHPLRSMIPSLSKSRSRATGTARDISGIPRWLSLDEWEPANHQFPHDEGRPTIAKYLGRFGNRAKFGDSSLACSYLISLILEPPVRKTDLSAMTPGLNLDCIRNLSAMLKRA